MQHRLAWMLSTIGAVMLGWVLTHPASAGTAFAIASLAGAHP